MSKKSKNEAAATMNASLLEQLTAEGLSLATDQNGFLPYFKFENDGDAIYAAVVGRDDTDPAFTRWTFENGPVPLECRKGPVDSYEIVTVDPGGYFTVSDYKTLLLEDYFDIKALITRVGEDRVKSDSKKTVIIFDVKMAPKDLEIVRDRRKMAMRQLMAATKAARALPPAPPIPELVS